MSLHIYLQGTVIADIALKKKTTFINVACIRSFYNCASLPPRDVNISE